MKNRILKFRVWTPDEEGKCFLNPDFFNITLDGKVRHIENGAIDKSVIIQQFTGLFDKNGKEIFEGDILISNNNQKHFPTEYKKVFFEDGSFKICWKSAHYKDIFWKSLDDISIRISQLTIVGNIFENPELLKKNKK